MNDTERMERVEIDLTPTTTPSWVVQVQMPLPVEPPPTPAPRGKRLARGTIPPRLSRLPLIPRPLPSIVLRTADAVLRALAEPGLAIHELPARLVPPPRHWGRVVRVDLDGAPIVHALPALPRRSISPLPIVGVLLAGIATLALTLGLSPERAASEPVARTQPALVAPTPAPALTEPTITPILAPGEGLLAIAATTPCRILIDGHDTGLVTPQRELRLAAGRHRVTLVDDVNGLEDHSEIEIGETPATVTRDLSAFLR